MLSFEFLNFLGNDGPVVVLGVGFDIVTLSIMTDVVVTLIISKDNTKLGYYHCHDKLDLIKIVGEVWFALSV